MKNLIRFLFFASLLLLMLPFQSQAQEILAQPSTGLFSKIGAWIQGNAIGLGVVFVFGFLAKHGWSLIIKKFASKGAVVTKEIGELFTDSSNFLNTLDKAIKDDGTIEQNSVKELLESGKHVIAEGRDVIISIKPK